MASNSLLAEIGPHPSRSCKGKNSLFFLPVKLKISEGANFSSRRKISAGDLSNPSLKNVFMFCSANPSISKAFREAKCIKRSND